MTDAHPHHRNHDLGIGDRAAKLREDSQRLYECEDAIKLMETLQRRAPFTISVRFGEIDGKPVTNPALDMAVTNWVRDILGQRDAVEHLSQTVQATRAELAQSILDRVTEIQAGIAGPLAIE